MFGGDDFFDKIAREFFSEGGSVSGPRARSGAVSRDQNAVISNMNANYDRVEGKKDYFVTVNFMDVVKKPDLTVDVEEGFSDEEEGDLLSGGDKALKVSNKGKKGSYIKVRIPSKIAKRKMEYKYNNGILEVRFSK